MRSLIINGVDVSNWGMILASFVIGIAPARTSTIEVPGRDGAIDVTDFVGLTYGNRPINGRLLVEDQNVFGKCRLYAESINGQMVDVVSTDEPELVWHGRLFMTAYERKGKSRRFMEFSFEMNADPFPTDAITGEEVRGVPNIG